MPVKERCMFCFFFAWHCTLMHRAFFAVDSFDHAMHPRLARETTKLFCKTILEQDKTVFVTTHNPLVLDGLDLMNDDIRLFAVNKSRKSGHTSLQRIQVTKELMDSGYSLSRLWTEGRLGAYQICNENDRNCCRRPTGF